MHPVIHHGHRFSNLRVSSTSLVALSPDGQYLVATLPDDAAVVFLDLQNQQVVHLTRLDPTLVVTCLLWRSLDELFVATSDNMVVTVSLRRGLRQRKIAISAWLPTHFPAQIKCMAFRGKTLALGYSSASSDASTVELWDESEGEWSGKCMIELPADFGAHVVGLWFLEATTLLICCRGQVYLWDSSVAAVAARVQPLDITATRAEWAPNHRLLAVVGESAVVVYRVYDLPDFHMQPLWRGDAPEGLLCTKWISATELAVQLGTNEISCLSFNVQGVDRPVQTSLIQQAEGSDFIFFEAHSAAGLTTVATVGVGAESGVPNLDIWTSNTPQDTLEVVDFKYLNIPRSDYRRALYKSILIHNAYTRLFGMFRGARRLRSNVVASLSANVPPVVMDFVTSASARISLRQVAYSALALMVLGYFSYVPDGQHQPQEETIRRDTLQNLRPGADQSSDFVILALALSKWACDSVAYLWNVLIAICSTIRNVNRTSLSGLWQIFGRIMGLLGSVLSFFGLGWAVNVKSWLPAITGLHQKFMFKACLRAGMGYCESKYGFLSESM